MPRHSLRWLMLESMFCRSRKVGSLDFANANSVWALGTFTDFKLNGITVSDLSGDLGDVDEKVVSTFNFNKSESFYLVKPLDSSLRHIRRSILQVLEEDGKNGVIQWNYLSHRESRGSIPQSRGR